MRKLVCFFTLFFIFFYAPCQKIKGIFNKLKNNTITLTGFNGLYEYEISQTTLDDKGQFSMGFSSNDYGLAYLSYEKDKNIYLVLSNEDIEIHGEAPISTNEITIIKGQDTRYLQQYAKEFVVRQIALSPLLYLKQFYQEQDILKNQNGIREQLNNEINRLFKEDDLFVESFPDGSFLRSYFTVRKLVSSTYFFAERLPHRIWELVDKYRMIDYNSKHLYKSELFKESINMHFWLIENSGKSLDSVFIEMNKSIDIMLPKLKKDPSRFEYVTQYLFNLLEERSLFTSSEYLALKILNDNSCSVNSDFSNRLESYRKMKIGNKVPNIQFDKNTTIFKDFLPAKTLYDVNSKYMLIIFAASWCSYCQTELPNLNKLYNDFKAKGGTFLLVSLDEKKDDYERFVASFPFTSTTDFQKWNGKAVKDYHVFGTPTMFLVDSDKKILYRIKSADHFKAWINILK